MTDFVHFYEKIQMFFCLKLSSSSSPVSTVQGKCWVYFCIHSVPCDYAVFYVYKQFSVIHLASKTFILHYILTLDLCFYLS